MIKQKILAAFLDDSPRRVIAKSDIEYTYDGISFEVYTKAEFADYINDIIDQVMLETPSVDVTVLVDDILNNFEEYSGGVFLEYDRHFIVTSQRFFDEDY